MTKYWLMWKFSEYWHFPIVRFVKQTYSKNGRFWPKFSIQLPKSQGIWLIEKVPPGGILINYAYLLNDHVNDSIRSIANRAVNGDFSNENVNVCGHVLSTTSTQHKKIHSIVGLETKNKPCICKTCCSFRRINVPV